MADYIYVSSGETSTGLVVKYNTMYVMSGGMATNTTAGARSYVFVQPDGEAYTTIVNSEGILILNGFADNTSVNSGGSMCISGWGRANGVTVNPGGEFWINDSGSAVQVVENGGYVADGYGTSVSFAPNVFTGAVLTTYATAHSGTVASRTYINDSGGLFIFSSGQAYETMVNSGGMFGVDSGGFASDTIAYGSFFVYEDATVTRTTVSSGGSMRVESKGIAKETEVKPGGTLIVCSGGTALEILENGGSVHANDEANCTFTPNVISGATLNNEATVHSGTTVTETVLNTRLNAYSSGIVSKTSANHSSAWINIYCGAIAVSNTVNAGGIQVYSGGTVNHTTLNSGYLDASSATVDNTTLNDGAFWVNKGTTANNTVVNSGSLILYQDAMVNITTVNDGKFNLHGTANSTTLNGGVASVCDGATANSTVVSGGAVDVLSGGSMSVVKVYGGTVNINAEAAAADVSALGGTVKVSSGAVLTGAMARDGRINVLSGGTAVGNGAINGGTINVNKGGTISGCTAVSSGRINITGGNALLTEIGNGGLLVLEGPRSLDPDIGGIGGKTPSTVQLGIASNTRVLRGGVVSVGSGGAAIDTILAYSSGGGLKPGLLDLESKGKELPVLDICGMYVNSSGLANSVTASKGGILVIGSKGKLVSGTILSGAVATVLADGIASGLSVLRGASASILGSTSQLVIGNSGLVELANGAIVQNTTVSSGGLLRTSAGAAVSSVTVNAGGTITGRYANLDSKTITLADGILDFDISELAGDEVCVEQLNFGFDGTYSCTLTVSSSQADGVYRLAGDAAGFSKTISVVNEDGEALGTLTVDGGKMTVGDYDYTLSLSEENLLSVQIRAAGGVDLTGDLTSEFVLTDGMVGSSVNVHTSDGRLIVSSGAVATQTTACEKGTLVVSEGGMADNTTVGSGGIFDVSSGTVNSTTVNNYASFTVFHGTADYNTINGGNMYLYSGTVANDTTVGNYAWVFVNGATANNTVVQDAFFIVASEGIANGTSLSSRGTLLLQSGGTANNTTVGSGGIFDVSSGCTANNTLVFFGQCTVSKGGTAINTIVSSGFAFLQSDATASGTKIYSGGTVYVSSGATAVDTVLNGGKLSVSSGGKVTGSLTIENGAMVSAESGGIIDFDLTRTSAGAAALVNDLSIVTGTPIYTLTVESTQADGTYKLAGDAAGFDKTITVQNESGEALGTLTVGATSDIGGTGYALKLGEDNVLSVTVGTAGPEPPVPAGPAKSDIDGNGISDVMFVWTGEHGEGNYQHGYWMNGTNTWQSANSNHPAEWENLGCYDMTGDGKADSVLFGNVISEAGIKGAYIGYYADANDLPDGSTWVNIGYLTNEDDIDWKNKVGNLTGNASGVNSIVWYAPEMYALGVWKDGREDWATLSSSFGGDAWTLVGCGDFDGDGKDSVLMTYNNGQMFYAVGIDGTPVSLGSADWSGWDVRAIGDFSGDQKDDIVLFHSDSGSMVMLADGNADSYTSIGQLDKTDWFVVGAGDYNNDQKDDLLVRQYSTGMLGYYNACDTSDTGWVELGRGVDMQWTVIA